MRLADLVAAVHRDFDVAAAMADVSALCEHDRYQASAGIDAAASYVAQRAADAGLHDVEVLHFPADGARRWWTFAGPSAWTPRRASVHVDGVPVLSYPQQPYSLAANSAPTAPGGVRLPLVLWDSGSCPDVADALVVLEAAPLPVALDRLIAGGAAGVVTDPLASRPDRWPEQVGRLELPVGCPLFAFSLTKAQAAGLRRAAQRSTKADVQVDVNVAGTLPVVTGRLPGGPRELLLSAHLCHPRPSANDNASGVAALLGLARAGEVFGRTGAAVRFVWAPEFIGMAAYLHDIVHAGRAPVPIAAVNVDMAGEDQRRCGGPLVIERAPEELPSPVSAIAERCAELIPPAARSYSGAVPCDTWAWRATPYVGASDHAMLAGPPTNCPAISIGHWPDSANHTGADTVDLVDPQELRRTATIAGATIAAMRTDDDPRLSADVTDATAAWAVGYVLSAMPGARPLPPAPPDGPLAEGPRLDPWAPEHLGRLLAHRGVVARDVIRSLPGAERVADWFSGLTAHVMASCPGGIVSPEPPPGPDDGVVLAPRWNGPMNLRHLAERSSAPDRRWLADVTAQDRGGSYARLLALARGIDGIRDGRSVAWWAAMTSGLAVPVDTASRFLGMLCRAGLAEPSME